jgi:Helix-turn-helix domain
VTDDLHDFRKNFLSEQEAAAVAEKSIRTLRAWRRRGEGPPFIKFGRTIKYRKASFLKHFEISEIIPARTRKTRASRGSRDALTTSSTD